MSPLILGCAATAFVPFHQKLALIPRHAPPVTSSTPQDLLNPWIRTVSRPLYSIFDDINKLNKGDEGDPMSKEDLKLLREVLSRIDETRAEDLVNLILQEIKEKAMPKAMTFTIRGKEIGGSTATMTAANATLASTMARPADAFNLTRVEVQGKAIFRSIRDFLEFLDKAADKDGQILKYATYPAHAEVRQSFVSCDPKIGMKKLTAHCWRY